MDEARGVIPRLIGLLVEHFVLEYRSIGQARRRSFRVLRQRELICTHGLGGSMSVVNGSQHGRFVSSFHSMFVLHRDYAGVFRRGRSLVSNVAQRIKVFRLNVARVSFLSYLRSLRNSFERSRRVLPRVMRGSTQAGLFCQLYHRLLGNLCHLAMLDRRIRVEVVVSF